MGLVWILLAVASGSISAIADKIPGVGALLGAGAAMFGIMGLLCIGNIYGAVQMWKGKLMGLWIYIGCEVAYFIMTVIVNMKAGSAAKEIAANSAVDMPEQSRQIMEASSKGGNFPVMGLVFTIAFIVMYWLNKKALK